MVEPFVGSWKLDTSSNFDDYMKKIGVPVALRQVGNMTKPTVTISVDEAGLVTIKTKTALKTNEVKFKLGEEFDETTADDRQAKTLFTLENGKLVQTQSWKGKTTTIEREVLNEKMITKCTMEDVVAVRTYLKA